MRCPKCHHEWETKTRSIPQNKRTWSVVVPVCREILSQKAGYPLTKEQTWDVLKSAFLGTIDTPLGPVPAESKNKTTAEFAELNHRIEAHFRREFGAVFPDDPEMVEESW